MEELAHERRLVRQVIQRLLTADKILMAVEPPAGAAAGCGVGACAAVGRSRLTPARTSVCVPLLTKAPAELLAAGAASHLLRSSRSRREASCCC